MMKPLLLDLSIYWRKKDLRSFVYHTIASKGIVATVDWENNTKRDTVSILIDRMTQTPACHGPRDPARRRGFPHCAKLDGKADLS